MIPEVYRKKYLTEQPFYALTNCCADFIVKGVLTIEDLRIMVDIAAEKAAYICARRELEFAEEDSVK